MDRARLYPVLDELKDRLQSNSVARGLLAFPIDYYTSLSKEEDLKSIRVRLGLLRNTLAGGRYRVGLQHEVIRLCKSDREKSEIRQAARSWSSVIGGIGFSRQFIHEVVSEEFFSNEVRYADSADLANFFRKFEGQKEGFEVFFSAGKVVAELSNVLKSFRCDLVESGDLHDEVLACGLTQSDDEKLILCQEISARDIYSARGIAEKRLEHISDLFAIFHHKNRIRWRPESVVRKINGKGRLVCAGLSSVARSRDNLPKKASQKLALHIGGLSFSDQDSLGRFISVVRLHGAAQEAASPQAQLVNLWTGMEVLVSRESDSKLKGVKRCITPFLAYGYIDKLLYALAGDMYRWKRKQVSKVLKKADLSEWSQHQKLAAVLLGGELESVRDELYLLLDGFPLLRNRCFHVSDLISSIDRLDKSIKGHEQRILWQIERIYRARNSIVHDGSAPPHVDALTENAHEYLDSFIDRFLILCSQMKAVFTLDEAIAYQTRLYEDWRKLLGSGKGVALDVNNIRAYCALGASHSA